MRDAIRGADSHLPHCGGMFRPLTKRAIAATSHASQSRAEMPKEEKYMVIHPQKNLQGNVQENFQENLEEKFDPDYVATLRRILDIAVENIAVENRTPATKAKMAQTIVREAAGGVTDATDLVSRAVRVGETRAA